MKKKIDTKKYIEKYLKIRNKNSQIVDLKLNDPQNRLYEIINQQQREKKPVRVIILKARQMGFSTLTEAVLFKETATNFNMNTGIITHLDTSTTNLFNMTKLYYDNLPPEMQPAQKASNAKEVIFDTDDGKGLKSKIKCMTAGTQGVGRSDTFNNLHISELAYWSGNKEETLIGLFQAVPRLPNTMIIIESTANGYELFKKIWDMAVNGENDFEPLFVAWYELDEYRMEYSGFELNETEKWLKSSYNLSDDQLEWRRWCIRNNCQGDEEIFKQEYPSNPQEAFLVSGSSVFNKEIIIRRIETIPKPIKTGYFTYDYDGLAITNIKWVTDRNGYINIYHVYNSPRVTNYCIGGDTAGDGSDYFTAQVLDAKSGIQVATLRNQFDADLYAKQMYCLGKMYGDALIGIESNFDSFPIRELERLGYKNQYIREKEDTYTGAINKSYGFRTTAISRPRILSNLIEIVREYTELLNDKNTLEEMLTFVRNEKGRPEAQQGAHDDLIMALAIAYDIKEQVVFNNNSIKINPQWQFEREETHRDYGETIKVI